MNSSLRSPRLRVDPVPVTAQRTAPTSPAWKRRSYQREAMLALRRHRLFAMNWRRQGGKTSCLAEMAIDEMTAQKGRLVVYVSASLLLGREIVFKEALVLQQALRMLAERAAQAGLKLDTIDRDSGKAAPANLGADDFADLFEHQRLELRIWHDKTVFSRTQVIAPNVATARSWSGTVLVDEYGFIRDFRDLFEAVEPIVSSDRTFKMVLATTPPKDDAHYSYEMTAPPVGYEFPVDPKGNWYRSDWGLDVHRVDVHDAAAAGVKLYDLATGAELTPQEHFARAQDKDAWRRNYGCRFVLGGTSACGLMPLDVSQRRGAGRCAFVYVDADTDFDRALLHLQDSLGAGEVAVGVDIATTTKETSNPTAVAIAERTGVDIALPLVLAWKTKDEQLSEDRLRRILRTCARRPAGGRARRLVIDATNERYFASHLRKSFGAEVPVELIVASERVERAGVEPMNFKEYLGSMLVGQLDDNRLSLPPERYLRDDWRLVKKERGAFVCEPDRDGRHGDTFDAAKLALYGLVARGALFPPAVFQHGRRWAAHEARRKREVAA
jgi:hypothetical protein